MMLFGLPLAGSESVDASLAHAPGSATLRADGFPTIEIRHSMTPNEPYSVDRFYVFPCFTGKSLPVDVLCLRLRHQGGRRTVGYVFPITSFRNELGYEDEYLLKYADAAFRGIMSVSMLTEYQSNGIWADLAAQPAHLDDVFHESLSVLALSKEVLRDCEVDGPLLDLILRRECINVCNNLSDLTSSPKIDHDRNEINLAKPLSDFDDDLLVLSNLLKSADQDNSEIGKFIQLYQYFEFMLRKVFEWGIPEAANNRVSPWEIKERLNKIAGEKYRLYLIEAFCLSKLTSRAAMLDLVKVSMEFLDSIETSYGNNREWHTLLYLVRNSVVHDQFAMLKSGDIAKLRNVNAALRQVVLDALFHFERPNTGSFFGDT